MATLTNGPRALLMTAVLLVSLNLRPSVVAVGPLTNLILKSTGVSTTGIGLLTMLPIFLMGLGALNVRWLRRAMGEKQGIEVGIFIIALSCVSRIWLDTAWGLFATAAGAGLGIAVVQALAPSFIKRNFSANTGRAIGLYSTGIVAGAATAAATAAGLADWLGWSSALAAWSVPALLSLAVWLIASRSALQEPDQWDMVYHERHKQKFWDSARSWSLLIFFGIGTGAFMLVMAWLPLFYVELGQTRQSAGYLLAGLTFVEALTALGLAAFIHHFPDRRGPLITSLLLVLAGLVCLLTEPLLLAAPIILFLGIGIGILFPLSIIVSVDHVNDPTVAGDFTAFVQGGGYIIASLVPLIAGALRDVFSDFSQAWILMALGIIALMILALRYSPASYLVFRRSLEKRAGRAWAKTEALADDR